MFNLPLEYTNIFQAFDEFGALMGQLERWKQLECHFPRVAPLIQYLLLSPLLSERSNLKKEQKYFKI